MKKRNAIAALGVFVGLAAAQSAMAFDCWPEDKTTQRLIIADNALMVLDWSQTRYIANHPESFHETGVLAEYIGEHPTTGEVNRGYATVMVAANLIGCVLPQSVTTFGVTWNPQKVFWIGATAIDAATVYENHSIGIRYEF